MKSLGLLLLAWSLADDTFGATTVRLAQQPGNILVDYLAYRHVAVVHFDVPEHALSVGFKFTAKEVKTGGLGVCDQRDVSINIKSGSLPLVRPDGSKIAAKLLSHRRRNYTVEAMSDGSEHVVNIPAPSPGDWYAIAYRSWQDPNNNQIKQQGLTASCDTVLDAEMSVELADMVYPLGEDSPLAGNDSMDDTIQLSQQSDSAVLEFRVGRYAERAVLTVGSSCGSECRVSLHVTAGEHLLSELVNASENSFGFRPYDDESLHYLVLRLETGEATNLTLRIDAEEDVTGADYPAETRLTRRTLPDFFFMYDYEHLPVNASKSAPVNLTADSLNLLRFKVAPVYDTGGTLSVGLRLAEDEKENIVLVGCLSLGYYSSISPAGGCVRELQQQRQQQSSDVIGPADIYSANRSSPGFVHVPYPESGIWHLSIRAYELVNGTKCECLLDCAQNGTDCSSECECAREVEARAESSIGSSPCLEAGCGSHGRCQHYTSGSFVFSACHCTGGYRGFDCADDLYVLGSGHLVARLLLLTLSNLAFIAAVVAAVKRHYYTEAVVYAAVMFFSTFYHACEAGEEGHSFCLLKLSVLQFCDFYNALLSIWVTLVAMASMGQRATSFCQMLGVVVLAVGAEMDRTALWVFLLPALIGCGLVIASWAIKCRQKGTLQYPARKYRLIYLPIGLTIVFIGLICYAFLQTQSNYYIVHSLWHVCVAVGATLLLPKREYMQ